MNSKLLAGIVITTILTILAIDDIVGDWSTIDGSFENLYVFFTQDLFPPDWSILSPEPNKQCNSEIGFSVRKHGKEFQRHYKWHSSPPFLDLLSPCQ